jgi:glycosyltransferase involved in cell wall biosynthesis
MRLAIFSELYAPSIGGQEAFFEGLAKALIVRGHAIDVYTIAHERNLAAVEDIAGVTVHRFAENAHYTAPRIKAMKRSWASIASYARHTAAIARTGSHDFYLLNQWPFAHAAALPRAARPRALLHWCEVRQGGAYRLLQAHLPRGVGLNAAISDAVGRQISAASGRPVFTLPSGLDLARSEYKPRAVRADLVVFGRVMEHKNVPLAVAAFERLRADGYSGRLKIAGDGPAMAALRARVAASPHAEAIDLLGFVEDAEKFRLLAGCDALLMPSRREGFPHVVAEAMCCGLPIVTADFPENGTRDIVDLYGSGAVTRQDPASFADGVRRALADWRSLSENGRRAAATLGWPSVAERLETEMIQAIARLDGR